MGNSLKMKENISMSSNFNFSIPTFGLSALTVLINLVVQLLIIVLAIKGIQALNIYIKKNS